MQQGVVKRLAMIMSEQQLLLARKKKKEVRRYSNLEMEEDARTRFLPGRISPSNNILLIYLQVFTHTHTHTHTHGDKSVRES